ncbi:hypothetical protein K437DRAFT_261781 [Tilletiaria anomala UBC 951]|uniref:PH domain-containing protein n=1 Tax=Tilletiaria anomala (strain ATCC 24038 / CBS 436.72 / UBC 951) TaxID=1037660 RepID=A0A066WBY6_TILAU|nr:uncharacterized protein K437DRAFT_261781 [Tilletiaria anomala UBC 951]KDN51452.1 hypothetical protein K437DRAFT_261781 [Tilletiaria anomala UBC 951]
MSSSYAGASAAVGSAPAATREVADDVAAFDGQEAKSIEASGRQKRVSREVSDALYSFKLLEALRTGDAAALQPFLGTHASSLASSAVAKAGSQGASLENNLPGTGEIRELTSPLHLAVRCAEDSTVALILSHKALATPSSPSNAAATAASPAFDVNAQEVQHGNTALHLASMTGRSEAVRMLLERPEIDDTRRNKEGKDPMEVAAAPEIATLFQVSRAELNAAFLSAVTAYERGHVDSDARIYALLSKPRYRAIDLNALAPETGSTLLHAAVQHKDAKMIETAARRGADVFCRDRKGKRILDTTKDEKIRALLRQLTNADNGLLATASQTALAPPSFKGYIGKWTNLAGRYKPRWFVLENGTLSYYHAQEDEDKQMRGSINLRYAKIRADSNDNHRFEIISDSGSKSANKLYLRGSHPVERARWVQLLQQTQEFFQLDRSQTASRIDGSGYLSSAGTCNHSTTSLIQPQPVLAGATVVLPGAVDTAGSNNAHGGGVSRGKAASLNLSRGVTPPPFRPASALSDRPFPPVASGGLTALSTLPASSTREAGSTATAMFDTPSLMSNISNSPNGERDGSEFSVLGDDDGVTDADSVTAVNTKKKRGMPHEKDFGLVSSSLTTQAELGVSLAESFGATREGDAPTHAALQDCLGSLQSLLLRFQGMVTDREAYMTRRYQQEIQAKLLWEENMKTLAHQHADMEAALKEAGEENARKRRVLREVRGSMISSPGSYGNLRSPSAEAEGTIGRTSTRRPVADEPSFSLPPLSLAARRDIRGGPSAIAVDSAQDMLGGVVVSSAAGSEIFRDSMDDADDEFFDAIETGNLPNLHIEKELISPYSDPEKVDKRLVNELSVEPYKKLRSQLPIGKDDRPSVSLWAILKNNIGKDLTKISFPVSFNEPTSMLQRMAEDMEFSECLDVASSCQDSTKRIAYVGAFAMSNYSSTIGRIAKPFNPLLGETFEYVSMDKKYRYLSEQVSHHPPISACVAESPAWQYLGCVDAKSKFLGRTFEIRPTGVAHANLKIPKEWAENHEKTPQEVKNNSELVMEHYTWNKVTTSVSGFIVGSPTIDHFGDMEITNHNTGDRCVLTFKPRGWRGKDAFEIRGAVYDASGTQVWDIAGRWNSQLVARRCGAGNGDLNPDEQVKGPAPVPGAGGPAAAAEYLLLWKNSEKPPLPFNLPPFAVTLNDLPQGLHPWLPPTDCRLRPDLRAFESGKFDQANGLKQGLEELQRATRRKREAGELPPHEPRWFKRTTDPDSKDTLWAPLTVPHPNIPGYMPPAYWEEREKVGSIKVEKGGEVAEWKDVFHIFGEFEV